MKSFADTNSVLSGFVPTDSAEEPKTSQTTQLAIFSPSQPQPPNILVDSVRNILVQ